MLKAVNPVASSLVPLCVASARKQKRAFHRIMSGIQATGSYKLLTLTSSPQSPHDIQRSWRRLTQRLQRRGILKDGYIRITEFTHEGRPHFHIIFRGNYVDQVLLSKMWASIHQAPVVDIRRVRSKRGLSWYLGKYLTKDNQGRLSWSFTWLYQGFVKAWYDLKRIGREANVPFSRVLTYWGRCCKLKRKPWEVIRWQQAQSYERELVNFAERRSAERRRGSLSKQSTPTISSIIQLAFPEGLSGVCVRQGRLAGFRSAILLAGTG